MKLLMLALAAAVIQAAEPVKVRLVTGGHDHEPSFYTMFEAMPGLKATVDPHPRAFDGNMLKRVDVLVLYDMMTKSTPEQRQKLEAFAKAGKGIVILHHAICGYVDWPWWYEEVAGGRYLESSTYQHDVSMPVEIMKKHPVTEGIAGFEILDETYKGMWISPKVNVLARTSHPSSDGPLVWISPYQQSRVVFIQLDHGSDAHRNPSYRKLVGNAVLWAAGRK